MATVDKSGTVTIQELLITSLAQTDAVAKLLIEKGVFTQDEFLEKLKAERIWREAHHTCPVDYCCWGAALADRARILEGGK